MAEFDPRRYLGAFQTPPPTNSAYNDLAKGAVLQTLSDRAAGSRNDATNVNQLEIGDRQNTTQLDITDLDNIAFGDRNDATIAGELARTIRQGDDTIANTLAGLGEVSDTRETSLGFEVGDLDTLARSLAFVRDAGGVSDLRSVGGDFVDPLNVDPATMNQEDFNFVRLPDLPASTRLPNKHIITGDETETVESFRPVEGDGPGIIEPVTTVTKTTEESSTQSEDETKKQREADFRIRLVRQFPNEDISEVFIDVAGWAHYTRNGIAKKSDLN